MKEKATVAKELGLAPDQGTANVIMVVIVVAIALVLVCSTGAMVWVFVQTGKLDPGAMLTVFTTVMGFVGGMLIKRPNHTIGPSASKAASALPFRAGRLFLWSYPSLAQQPLPVY